MDDLDELERRVRLEDISVEPEPGWDGRLSPNKVRSRLRDILDELAVVEARRAALRRVIDLLEQELIELDRP